MARQLRVYGSVISYFTGKLEAYLRYKELPYELVPMTARLLNGAVPRATGVAQMPAVELPDGRWLTDTTPMIAWFESRYPEPPVIPRDPLQAFASRLLEDYADEWLWRPALHYRWSYRPDALLLSHAIVTELLPDVPGPPALKRWLVRRRQRRRYVRGDAVTAATRAHVEGLYRRTLAILEAMVATRPFLLGDVPTLADFGFFASMFRHFGSDPTPAALMRAHAPGVYAWVARVWAARASRTHGALMTGVPEDWGPFLADIGIAYLPYLCANAAAWAGGRRRFDLRIQGTPYTGIPTSRYRVWCLQELRRHFEALPDDARATAERLLDRHGAWAPFARTDVPDSGYDPDRRAPFGPGLGMFGR